MAASPTAPNASGKSAKTAHHTGCSHVAAEAACRARNGTSSYGRNGASADNRSVGVLAGT
ncbi:hypothetical protein Asi02nite_62710 [Asanoa siamensis]|uniref:Uncharacterized protein n=1 Tax=Asanoa siamensis TaxID=926357 RepID=A0ABQ4CZN1_9ACTN|nr:hypothetical protein Asi02nite_62710 [Asanoa siamensis]